MLRKSELHMLAPSALALTGARAIMCATMNPRSNGCTWAFGHSRVQETSDGYRGRGRVEAEGLPCFGSVRLFFPMLLFLFFSVSIALPEDVIFAVRQSKGPHWYENFAHAITSPNKLAYGAGGRLCRLNPDSGQVTVLVDDPQGSVRDPQVHYDGEKILFSYRKGGSPYFQLYEIGVDGAGLKQLTSAPFDDLEPCYLPDGGIVFCSSRCKRYVPCWYVQVATLYRCDRNGRNIRSLSSNIEQDNTPWVLPD